MEQLTTTQEMTAWSRRQRREGYRIALVPTMGALHDGHLELVSEAAKTADRVVVSIFVNPTQFGPNEDFERYPRMLAEDVAALAGQGLTSVVFAPTVDTMYPFGRNRTWVEVEGMDQTLCGATRPGHFRGVTTIVSRLFTTVLPDVAVFGLKDAQQFFILSRMTREMGFPVRMLGVPTVREADGLAMSSRNRYLTPDERADAPRLYRAVCAAREAIMAGERNADILEGILQEELKPARTDYASVVETDGLTRTQKLESGSTALVAVAVHYGKARLIDNAIVDVP